MSTIPLLDATGVVAYVKKGGPFSKMVFASLNDPPNIAAVEKWVKANALSRYDEAEVLTYFKRAFRAEAAATAATAAATATATTVANVVQPQISTAPDVVESLVSLASSVSRPRETLETVKVVATGMAQTAIADPGAALKSTVNALVGIIPTTEAVVTNATAGLVNLVSDVGVSGSVRLTTQVVKRFAFYFGDEGDKKEVVPPAPTMPPNLLEVFDRSYNDAFALCIYADHSRATNKASTMRQPYDALRIGTSLAENVRFFIKENYYEETSAYEAYVLSKFLVLLVARLALFDEFLKLSKSEMGWLKKLLQKVLLRCLLLDGDLAALDELKDLDGWKVNYKDVVSNDLSAEQFEWTTPLISHKVEDTLFPWSLVQEKARQTFTRRKTQGEVPLEFDEVKIITEVLIRCECFLGHDLATVTQLIPQASLKPEDHQHLLYTYLTSLRHVCSWLNDAFNIRNNLDEIRVTPPTFLRNKLFVVGPDGVELTYDEFRQKCCGHFLDDCVTSPFRLDMEFHPLPWGTPRKMCRSYVGDKKNENEAEADEKLEQQKFLFYFLHGSSEWTWDRSKTELQPWVDNYLAQWKGLYDSKRFNNPLNMGCLRYFCPQQESSAKLALRSPFTNNILVSITTTWRARTVCVYYRALGNRVVALDVAKFVGIPPDSQMPSCVRRDEAVKIMNEWQLEPIATEDLDVFAMQEVAKMDVEQRGRYDAISKPIREFYSWIMNSKVVVNFPSALRSFARLFSNIDEYDEYLVALAVFAFHRELTVLNMVTPAWYLWHNHQLLLENAAARLRYLRGAGRAVVNTTSRFLGPKPSVLPELLAPTRYNAFALELGPEDAVLDTEMKNACRLISALGGFASGQFLSRSAQPTHFVCRVAVMVPEEFDDVTIVHSLRTATVVIKKQGDAEKRSKRVTRQTKVEELEGGTFEIPPLTKGLIFGPSEKGTVSVGPYDALRMSPDELRQRTEALEEDFKVASELYAKLSGWMHDTKKNTKKLKVFFLEVQPCYAYAFPSWTALNVEP